MTEAASAGRPPPELLKPGSPLWPDLKFSGARLPAKSQAPNLLRPSAPLSLGLKYWGPAPRFSRTPSFWDLAPRKARPQVFCGPAPRSRRTTSLGGLRPGSPLWPGPKSLMRPGAPLSPGLTEKTRYKPAWFTSDDEVSQRSFLESLGAWQRPRAALDRGQVTCGSAAGRCAARRPGRRSAVSGPRW
jgi:hypothetical protein